jgi:hypothetical protein
MINMVRLSAGAAILYLPYVNPAHGLNEKTTNSGDLTDRNAKIGHYNGSA